jgi:DNA-binding CsgD family transcriptional regulator
MNREGVNARRDRIAELTRQGLTPPVIAAMLHVSEPTVYHAKKLHGLTRPRHSLTPTQIERAKMFLDDGASYVEVGRTIGVCHQTLRRHIPGYEYTPAQQAEASAMARKMNSLEWRGRNGCGGTGT